MRIGFDAKRIFNNYTGLGNYSRTLVDNLCQFAPKNDYLLFAPRISDNEFGDYYSKNYQVITPNGVGGTIWRSYGINSAINDAKIDVFHGLSNELPFRLKHTKKVLTIHDLIFKVLPDTYTVFDRQVYDLKSRKSCQNADTVIAISQATKDAIIYYYGIKEEKIKVVYQACNPVYYNTEQTEIDIFKKYNLPQKFFLSVGSVIPRKNLLNTVKGIAQLPRDLQLPLVVIGRGKEYKNKIIAFLRKENRLQSVIWLENVHDILELKSFYQNAVLSLYTSKHEGFGLPVAESMLCRTPVVTSNISSLPEAGGEGAILVNPDAPEEIAAAVEKIVSSENFAEECIKKGYNYAKNTFDPEKLTRQLIGIYQT